MQLRTEDATDTHPNGDQTSGNFGGPPDNWSDYHGNFRPHQRVAQSVTKLLSFIPF